MSASGCSVYSCDCSATGSHSIYTCTTCNQRAEQERILRERQPRYEARAAAMDAHRLAAGAAVMKKNEKPPLSPAAPPFAVPRGSSDAGGKKRTPSGTGSVSVASRRSTSTLSQRFPSYLMNPNQKRRLTPELLHQSQDRLSKKEQKKTKGEGSEESGAEFVPRRLPVVLAPSSRASSFTHTSAHSKASSRAASSMATSDVRRLAQLEAELEQEKNAKDVLKKQVESLSTMQSRLEELLLTKRVPDTAKEASQQEANPSAPKGILKNGGRNESGSGGETSTDSKHVIASVGLLAPKSLTPGYIEQLDLLMVEEFAKVVYAVSTDATSGRSVPTSVETAAEQSVRRISVSTTGRATQLQFLVEAPRRGAEEESSETNKIVELRITGASMVSVFEHTAAPGPAGEGARRAIVANLPQPIGRRYNESDWASVPITEGSPVVHLPATAIPSGGPRQLRSVHEVLKGEHMENSVYFSTSGTAHSSVSGGAPQYYAVVLSQFFHPLQTLGCTVVVQRPAASRVSPLLVASLAHPHSSESGNTDTLPAFPTTLSRGATTSAPELECGQLTDLLKGKASPSVVGTEQRVPSSVLAISSSHLNLNLDDDEGELDAQQALSLLRQHTARSQEHEKALSAQWAVKLASHSSAAKAQSGGGSKEKAPPKKKANKEPVAVAIPQEVSRSSTALVPTLARAPAAAPHHTTSSPSVAEPTGKQPLPPVSTTPGPTAVCVSPLPPTPSSSVAVPPVSRAPTGVSGLPVAPPVPASSSATATAAPTTLPLAGVRFVLSGYVNPKRGELKGNLIKLGAKEDHSGWIKGESTHLIAAFERTPKVTEVSEYLLSSSGALGCIVTTPWVDACLKDKTKESEDLYRMMSWPMPSLPHSTLAPPPPHAHPLPVASDSATVDVLPRARTTTAGVGAATESLASRVPLGERNPPAPVAPAAVELVAAGNIDDALGITPVRRGSTTLGQAVVRAVPKQLPLASTVPLGVDIHNTPVSPTRKRGPVPSLVGDTGVLWMSTGGGGGRVVDHDDDELLTGAKTETDTEEEPDEIPPPKATKRQRLESSEQHGDGSSASLVAAQTSTVRSPNEEGGELSFTVDPSLTEEECDYVVRMGSLLGWHYQDQLVSRHRATSICITGSGTRELHHEQTPSSSPARVSAARLGQSSASPASNASGVAAAGSTGLSARDQLHEASVAPTEKRWSIKDVEAEWKRRSTAGTLDL